MIITGRTLATLQTAVVDIKKVAPATLLHPIVADSSSPEQVAALWAEVGKKVGKVDVLINNAGIAGTHTKLGSGKVKEWLEVQVINPSRTCVA